LEHKNYFEVLNGLSAQFSGGNTRLAVHGEDAGDNMDEMSGVGETLLWSPDPARVTKFDEFCHHLRRRHPHLSYIGMLDICNFYENTL
jgi:hypothetical protein